MLPKRHKPPKPIPPGLYPYLHDENGAITRFHLRVEPDGQGMLLATAAAAARSRYLGEAQLGPNVAAYFRVKS